MNNQSPDNEMPAEIDFSKAARGVHHIPPLTEVLKRDIEINEALK